MALTMNCINVFYQLNEFILFLSMYEDFLNENWNNKKLNLPDVKKELISDLGTFKDRTLKSILNIGNPLFLKKDYVHEDIFNKCLNYENNQFVKNPIKNCFKNTLKTFLCLHFFTLWSFKIFPTFVIFLRMFLLSKFFDKFKISIMLFILVTKKNCSNKIIWN